MNKIDIIISDSIQQIDILPNSAVPKIVFIGGLPGTGKSLLIKKAQLDFSDDLFVIIEPDLYKSYFCEKNSVEETVNDCNKIESELLNYSLHERKNLIHLNFM